jgi:hypothetical protein
LSAAFNNASGDASGVWGEAKQSGGFIGRLRPRELISACTRRLKFDLKRRKAKVAQEALVVVGHREEDEPRLHTLARRGNGGADLDDPPASPHPFVFVERGE